MIDFDDEDVSISDRLKTLGKESVEAVMDYVEFDYDVDVTITITNNEVIQAINKEHRKIDNATDVLSFPMIDWLSPCDYDYFEGLIDSFVNPDTGCILLGDIVLSMDKVIEQAKDYKQSIEREYSFLIVHSMLHLFGYDHMNESDESAMIGIQKEIMKTIKYEK